MSVTKLPTGLSVTQAKKDAKRLAKNSNTSLSQALNQVAHKHGRADWPTLINQLNTQSNLSVTLKQGANRVHKMDFSGSKSLISIIGQSGSGKSVLMLEFAAQFLKSGIPVLYLGADLSEVCHAGLATKHLATKYENLFTVIPTEIPNKKSDIDHLLLNGAVLLIDEVAYQSARDESVVFIRKIADLINASMNTFITSQVPDEIQELLSQIDDKECTTVKVIALPLSHYDKFEPSLSSKVKDLKRERNQYTELLWVESGNYTKLRFNLSDHSALR